MRDVVSQNLNAPFNWRPIHPAWFDDIRPLLKPFIQVKLRTPFGWSVLSGSPDPQSPVWLSESDGLVVKTDEDIRVLIDGVSTQVYAETPEEYLNHVVNDYKRSNLLAETAVEGIDYFFVDDSNIPGDHACHCSCDWYDTWEWSTDNGCVQANLPMAQRLQLARIREARNIELDRIDATSEYRAADREARRGNTAAWEVFDAEKQVLRDVPETCGVELCTNIAELGASWPDNIPRVGYHGVIKGATDLGVTKE